MEEDRTALEWIVAAANIRDMEVLEAADEHVSVTPRFGFMDESRGLNSEIFKAIIDILDLCHRARNRDWDAVEARRRELEVEASPQAVEKEVFRVEIAAGERQQAGDEDMSLNSLEIDGGSEAGEDGMKKDPSQVEHAEAVEASEAERARELDSDNNDSRVEEEGVPKTGRSKDGDISNDSSDRSGWGWGRRRPTFGDKPVYWSEAEARTQRDRNPQ